MVARVWHGVVPSEKASGYEKYLAESDLGIPDYRKRPGNRGAFLLKRAQADRVHFLLVSFWDSREAVAGYAGPNIEQAQYFPYDLECLLEPEPTVTHFEVVAGLKGENVL